MKIILNILFIAIIQNIFSQTSLLPFHGGTADGFAITSSDSNTASACILSGFDLGETQIVCPGTNIELTANETYNASFLWSNGADTKTISVTESGIYSVTATAGTCTFTDSVEIIFQPTIETSQNIKPATGEFISDGGARVKVIGSATPSVSYLWETGAETNKLINVLPDTYTLTLTDNLTGCSKQLDIIIPFDTCEAAYNLTATDSGTTQVYLSWQGTTETVFLLQYVIPALGISNTTSTGISTSALIPVISDDIIKIRVYSTCDGEHLVSSTLVFTPSMLRTSQSASAGPELFPNPTTDKLEIIYIPAETENIFISDMSGRKMMDLNLSSTQNSDAGLQIDVSNLPDGLYTIHLIGKLENHYINFVKED